MYVSVDGRIFDAMTAHYNVSPCMFFLRNEVFLAISFRHVYIYKMRQKYNVMYTCGLEYKKYDFFFFNI